jgi:hypothetical protein
MHPDRAQAAELGRTYRRDAADRRDSSALALLGQPLQFQFDDRLYRGGFVGYWAEHLVFPHGFYVLSKTTAPLECPLRRLCGLAYRGIYSSVVAPQITAGILDSLSSD